MPFPKLTEQQLGLFKVVNRVAQQEQAQEQTQSQVQPQSQPQPPTNPLLQSPMMQQNRNALGGFNMPASQATQPARNALGGFNLQDQTAQIAGTQKASEAEKRGGVKVFGKQLTNEQIQQQTTEKPYQDFIEVPRPAKQSFKPSFFDILKEVPSVLSDKAKEIADVMRRNAEVFKYIPGEIGELFKDIGEGALELGKRAISADMTEKEFADQIIKARNLSPEDEKMIRDSIETMKIQETGKFDMNKLRAVVTPLPFGFVTKQLKALDVSFLGASKDIELRKGMAKMIRISKHSGDLCSKITPILIDVVDDLNVSWLGDEKPQKLQIEIMRILQHMAATNKKIILTDMRDVKFPGSDFSEIEYAKQLSNFDVSWLGSNKDIKIKDGLVAALSQTCK